MTVIKFSKDNGTSFTDIAFPAGVWNYRDINQHIREATVIKQQNEDDKYPISLEFDETTFRVTITMDENYQLDLTTSNFYNLIGFDKKVLKDRINVGPRVPDLSQDTDILNIHCDLINQSLIDGQDSDIEYSFSTSVLRPLYSFTLEPRRVTYYPVNKNTISTIRIYITDGRGRIIDLNGADTAFSLILKRII